MMIFLVLCLLYDVTFLLSITLLMGIFMGDWSLAHSLGASWHELPLVLFLGMIPSSIYGVIMVLSGNHRSSRLMTIFRSVVVSLFPIGIAVAVVLCSGSSDTWEILRETLGYLPPFVIAGLACGYFVSRFPKRIGADWYGQKGS